MLAEQNVARRVVWDDPFNLTIQELRLIALFRELDEEERAGAIEGIGDWLGERHRRQRAVTLRS